MSIIIRQATLDDFNKIVNFFEFVIADTFIRNKIEDEKGIKEEVIRQRDLLKNSFNLQGRDGGYLIAIEANKIIGTLAIVKEQNQIIRSAYPELKDIHEVSSVYVDPEHQNKGVGSLLFSSAISLLESRGINKYCLDCGYPVSQAFWVKKLGEPDRILMNYWGIGSHHMIWVKKVLK